ncbi:Pyridine nucleotide-disulfide oxidoreductase [Globisporangium polare]
MPRIVIIGAGPGGLAVAQALAKSLKPADNTDVVVLEKSEFYYHTIGTPRAYTEESFTPKLFIPYKDVIPAAAASFVKIVRGVATRISAETNQVTYHAIGSNNQESGQDIVLSFDYLVVATGSSYTVPIKQDGNANSRADTEAKLKEVRREIVKAQNILVVGGGAVGCEVAGDIASKYPNKNVTIVEAGSKLVAGANLRDKFRDKLMNSMKELNINVVLGERLTKRLSGNSFEKQTLVTDKGTRLESDIQLLCGGFHPIAELVQDMDASLVDERGFIKVNMQLQLDSKRFDHVFALGDASNHPTPKLAFVAGQQGTFLATELVAVIRKKQPSFTKPFPKMEVEAMIMPLGPNGGVSQLPVMGGLVFGNFLTRMLKSKDFFVGNTWGQLNATMPN